MVTNLWSIDSVRDPDELMFSDAIEHEVVMDSCPFIETSGVMASIHFQLPYIVGRHCLKEFRGLRSFYDEPGHVRCVEDADSIAYRHVFLTDVTVSDWHLPTCKRNNITVLLMPFKEVRAFELLGHGNSPSMLQCLGTCARFYFLSSIPRLRSFQLTPHTVRVGKAKLGASHPVRIMGVLNLSQESFYSDSVATTEEQIRDRVRQMEKEGVDIIDIGGASTAPTSIYGTPVVTEKEELERVGPALDVAREATKLPLSVDTTSSMVAKKAVDLGASLVNDVSGLRKDPKMAKLVADLEVPVVLMAMCKKPCDSVLESVSALRESIEIAENAGVPTNKLIVDPGIGFGKPAQTDYDLLRRLSVFTMFGHPVLVGVSRKAFIGELLGLPDPGDRLIGSAAATAIAVARGADVVRAHDVEEARMAGIVGEALRGTSRLSEHDVELLNIHGEKEAEIVIERVGVGSAIRQALSKKAVTLNVLLKDVRTPAALIIKQEMLALGGDAAYHRDTIDSGVDHTDVLVMGTPVQLERLTRKLSKMTYFDLDKTSKKMDKLLDLRERGLW